MRRLAAGIVLFGSFVAAGRAAGPQFINYQGRLINGTNLVNAQVGLTLRIYTNATTGAYLFEDSNTVTVVDGLYSALLGANPRYGTLTNALASGSVWIQVMINGLALSPREPIGASAFALDGNFVRKTGDTMTGDLTIRSASLLISNYVDRGDGPRSVARIGGGQDVEIGSEANGYWYGAAVGMNANGYSGGAAVGPSANAAVDGVGVGDGAIGPNYGVAVGASSDGSDGGTAVGETAIARNHGVAVGSNADGSQTNIAVGYLASAGEGVERIAIGHNVQNLIDHSIVVRGTLFLDGGSNVYYRDTFNSGTWKALALSTSAPVYVEVDPRWTAASNGMQSQINGKANSNMVWSTFVKKSGDTMTGNLVINSGSSNDLTITSAGTDVQVGNAANGDNAGTAVGCGANGATAGVGVGNRANGFHSGAGVGEDAQAFDNGVAVGRQANGSNQGVAVGSQAKGFTNGVAVGFDAAASSNGVAVGLGANGSGNGVAVGYQARGGGSEGGAGAAVGYWADASQNGIAVGYRANGASNGVSVGSEACGIDSGVAVGYQANGGDNGMAMGRQASGHHAGVAVGALAKGTNNGVAVGYFANANEEGVAVGFSANGVLQGIALGEQADGAHTNIAIGCRAIAHSGSERIAIGTDVENDIDDSARIRGNLYLDGGSSVYTRSTFGSGSFSVKAFTIDHPLDPTNRVLRHYCLEGPQVWNVYAGNAQLVNGIAVVQLPEYYGAENKAGSEVYELTAVGGQASLWIEREVSKKSFVIGGDKDVKVSWTVKVLRNDPAALQDLKERPVEQLKSALKPGQAPAENRSVNTTP